MPLPPGVGLCQPRVVQLRSHQPLSRRQHQPLRHRLPPGSTSCPVMQQARQRVRLPCCRCLLSKASTFRISSSLWGIVARHAGRSPLARCGAGLSAAHVVGADFVAAVPVVPKAVSRFAPIILITGTDDLDQPLKTAEERRYLGAPGSPAPRSWRKRPRFAIENDRRNRRQGIRAADVWNEAGRRHAPQEFGQALAGRAVGGPKDQPAPWSQAPCCRVSARYRACRLRERRSRSWSRAMRRAVAPARLDQEL